MSGLRRLSLVPAVLVAGCLVEPNPKFAGTAASDTSTGEAGDPGARGAEEGGSEGCPEGLLDCDDEPGCETPADDPNNCGSCAHSCEFEGEVHACLEGICEAELIATDFPDAYTDFKHPDEIFGDKKDFHVDAGPEPEYIFLELPEPPAMPVEASVASIRLQLECKTPLDPPVLLQAYLVEEAWAEDAISWNNSPEVSPSPALSFEAVEGPNTIELIDLVDEWPSGRGISLHEPLDTVHIVFESRETDESSPPTLTWVVHW